MDILTVQEVATILRMKPVSIYRMAQKNLIPHFKIGVSLRFKRADIDALTNTGG